MIRQYLRDPDMPTVALAFMVTLVVAFLTLSGCGASSLERHTVAASILHASVGEAAGIIEADARRAADEATRPCRDESVDVSVCQHALDAVMLPRRRAADVQGLLAASVDAYVLVVLTMARAEDPDWSLALASLSRIMSVYEELSGLLGEYGIGLPPIGPLVLGLLGGD